MKVTVVIPTIERVADLSALIGFLRSQASPGVDLSFVVVQNGPVAREPHVDEIHPPIERLIRRSEYLGSEGGFLTGLQVAQQCERYLLLDEDATLDPESFDRLLAACSAFPDAVISGSHNGHGWWIGQSALGIGSEPVPITRAPWSGLVLTPAARSIALSSPSQYFFLWDDYSLCWKLEHAGIQLIGVPRAVIGNRIKSSESVTPWRAYYRCRNELLYRRDTGSGGMVRALLMRARFAAGAVRRGNLAVGAAVYRGMVDGLMDRRGMRMLPGSAPE
ncbi:MAG: hypothetical protein M0013_11955 [Actinomycetota bacterium]|nr:hypothetical protein [Actinomycetota bacterium]